MAATERRWASVSKIEFPASGQDRHLVRRGAITSFCGHTASDPTIWRADRRKPKCRICAAEEEKK